MCRYSCFVERQGVGEALTVVVALHSARKAVRTAIVVVVEPGVSRRVYAPTLLIESVGTDGHLIASAVPIVVRNTLVPWRAARIPLPPITPTLRIGFRTVDRGV